jgi:RNA polymerase sigma factor for flagellar operon FliA
VQEAVRSLSEREQVIVDLYYYQDLTFKEISDVLGVTESRVSQLHTRLKKRIREDLVSLA